MAVKKRKRKYYSVRVNDYRGKSGKPSIIKFLTKKDARQYIRLAKDLYPSVKLIAKKAKHRRSR